MKTIRLLPILFVCALLGGCASVRVSSDFDKNASFDTYKTFAFYKTGIDKAEISDLDKRRILRAIENRMIAKGFTKSDNPDLLVNIFTNARKEVNVNQFYGGMGYGWGYGWHPWMWGGARTSVSTDTKGSLYIDLIDAKKKELVWQGKGDGSLEVRTEKKDERIAEFVDKILESYPPQPKK